MVDPWGCGKLCIFRLGRPMQVLRLFPLLNGVVVAEGTGGIVRTEPAVAAILVWRPWQAAQAPDRRRTVDIPVGSDDVFVAGMAGGCLGGLWFPILFRKIHLVTGAARFLPGSAVERITGEGSGSGIECGEVGAVEDSDFPGGRLLAPGAAGHPDQVFPRHQWNSAAADVGSVAGYLPQNRLSSIHGDAELIYGNPLP